MLRDKYVLEELRRIVSFHNQIDKASVYGLHVGLGEPIHYYPAAEPTYTDLAETAIAQFDSTENVHVFQLPDADVETKSLYLWRLSLGDSVPESIAWCVTANENTSWEPFLPLCFREFGLLCATYLDSCYSTKDLDVLIGCAFEVGASGLALNLIKEQTNADSVILWSYQPEGHYLQAEAVVGAARGRYVVGIGKGVAGRISPTNRHVMVDLNDMGGPQPFHPDLIRSEGWTRLQYAAICSQGALLGAIGLYWRADNASAFISSVEALRMANLATIMLAAEQAQMTLAERLDSVEKLLVKLTPAQALIAFFHDVQRSLKDVATAMNAAAVVLEKASTPDRKALAAQLSRSSDFIDGCMNRMARLVLLQQKVTNRRRVDLHRLLRNMEPVLVSHSVVDVSIRAGSEPVWIRADRLAVERAVLNLVSNAVYWTEIKLRGERRVTVSLKSQDGLAVIGVEDTGLGVIQEIRDRLFEKFVTGRPGSGSGLGLYLVYETMRLHGGEVSFFANKRQGTTFQMKFPLLEGS